MVLLLKAWTTLNGMFDFYENTSPRCCLKLRPVHLRFFKYPFCPSNIRLCWVILSVYNAVHLSDMFSFRKGLKQGEALSPLLFTFSLVYAIRRVQINQDGFKLNGAHQLLVYADDINIWGRRLHTIKNNKETLLVGSKETGLEVNAEKTKHVAMSRDQNTRRSHNVMIYFNSLERVEEFKYLEKTLTNQNSFQE